MKRLTWLLAAFLFMGLGCSDSDPVRPQAEVMAPNPGKVLPVGPDVAILGFSASLNSVRPGDTVIFTAQIGNLGDTAAGPFTVSIVEPVSRKLIARKAVAGLPTGIIRTGTVSFRVPFAKIAAAVQPGTYTLVCSHSFNDAYPANDSRELDILVIDTVPPTAPTGLVAVRTAPDVILVSWHANGEPDLGGYRLYINSSSPATNGPYVDLPAGETGKTYQGMPALTFYFTILAVDLAGNFSAPAAEISCPPF